MFSMASELNQYWQRYELGGLVARRNQQVMITGIYCDLDQPNGCREENPQADISTNIGHIGSRFKQ
jgi:hypothetical protein